MAITSKTVEQKRLLDRVRIIFSDESLTYSIKDRAGSRIFAVKYLDLNPGSRYELQERNEYFRNVGFLWAAIAIFDLIVGSGISTVLWGGLAIICLGIYYFASTKYIVMPSSQGMLYIIADGQATEIIDELIERYRKAVMEEYGPLEYAHTFEEEKRKYRTLLQQGIIDDAQFSKILSGMEQNKDKFLGSGTR